jgi:hypothetical protein
MKARIKLAVLLTLVTAALAVLACVNLLHVRDSL